MQHFPEEPVYVVAFIPRGFYFSSSGVQSKVAKSITADGTLFIMCKQGDAKKLAKKVTKKSERIL